MNEGAIRMKTLPVKIEDILPTHNNVLIEIPNPDKIGSIVLPEGTNLEDRIGTVIAAGPGIHHNSVWIECTAKVGTRVLLSGMLKTIYKLPTKQIVMLIDERDILAVVNGPDVEIPSVVIPEPIGIIDPTIAVN